jgi:hypothetical protein
MYISDMIDGRISFMANAMVFNAAFNNISVISRRSVLLVAKPDGLAVYHRDGDVAAMIVW